MPRYILHSNNVAGEDTSEYYLVYDNVEEDINKTDKKKVPKDLNYNVLGLKKERIFNKGELKTVKYWKNYDEQTETYSDLCVQEENTYNRNSDGFLVNRDKEITWFKQNGGPSSKKSTKKYYNSLEGASADDRSRAYILAKVKIDCIGLLAATTGMSISTAKATGLPFVSSLALEMSQYRDGDRQPFIDAVTNFDTQGGTVYGRLDNDTGINDGQGGTLTIRQYVIYSVSP